MIEALEGLFNPKERKLKRYKLPKKLSRAERKELRRVKIARYTIATRIILELHEEDPIDVSDIL